MSEVETFDPKAETPRLVVVCGLPGVGKTTVSEGIADRFGAKLLRTDVIRKELLSDPDYTEEEARMVYDELFDRAGETVERGRSVVLDGTFKDAGYRDRAMELSEGLDAEFRLVKVECAQDVVRERIREREGPSDADFEVHAMYREQFDSISHDCVTVDNSGDYHDTVRQVDEAFGSDADRATGEQGRDADRTARGQMQDADSRRN